MISTTKTTALLNTLVERFKELTLADKIIYSLLLCLQFIGTPFSKLNIFWVLHLHDLLLVIGTLWVLVRLKFFKHFWPIYALIFISVVYALVSLLVFKHQPALVIRQYALFGYLGCFLVLYSSEEKPNTNSHIFFILFLSSSSLVLQLIALVKEYGFSETLPDHIYYSPLALMSLGTAAATLVYISNRFIKLLVFISILLLCISTTHASLFLSLCGVLFIWAFLCAGRAGKALLIIATIVAFVLLLLKVDQFNDINARWRLLFWKHTLTERMTEGYGIIGKGFGVPYADTETEMYLWHETTSAAFVDNGDPRYERYYSPMHNSFVTIMFAIGIIPGLLIFRPYFYLFTLAFTSKKKKSQELLFLALCLVGCTVWVSFNVILELPHSALFFWLVYFSFWTTARREIDS